MVWRLNLTNMFFFDFTLFLNYIDILKFRYSWVNITLNSR